MNSEPRDEVEFFLFGFKVSALLDSVWGGGSVIGTCKGPPAGEGVELAGFFHFGSLRQIFG